VTSTESERSALMVKRAEPPGPPGHRDLAADAAGNVYRSDTVLSERDAVLLAPILERRYLDLVGTAELPMGRWTISPDPDDDGRPLLREVRAVGRPEDEAGWTAAMPHALTAAHVPGQAMMMVLYGDGRRQHLYFGGRRQALEAPMSTEAYLAAQDAILRAHVQGLELGPQARLDADGLPELATFLSEAPALGLLTGIPSSRSGGISRAFQSLDRLTSAVGDRRYAIVVVAEPLEAMVADDALERCRQLKTEIHAQVRRSTATSHGSTSSTSSPTGDAPRAKTLPLGAVAGLALFTGVAGAFLPGISALGQGVYEMTILSNQRAMRDEMRHNRQRSEGESRNLTETVEVLDATAEACESLLQRHIDRLQAGRSQGWWRTSVYVAADGDASLEAVAGALRAMASGDATVLEPLRLVRPGAHYLRGALVRGQGLSLLPAPTGDEPRASHPLGPAYDSLGTCMTSDELAVLMSPPQSEIPGIPMRDIGRFGLTAAVPDEEDEAIVVGTLLDGLDRPLGPVCLSGRSLNRHVFVSGMTGYGKTTTCMRILVEAYRKLGVPFFVIEPAKSEYRRLAALPEMNGKLRVFGIGPGAHQPLRLNPFRPVPSQPLSRHIDLIKAVFNASFPMFAGMSYILEEAILKVYADRGWSLTASSNALLGPRHSADDEAALTPSLRDLLGAVDIVLAQKNYGGDVHQNMGAALRSRLQSLMLGSKGMALAARRSLSASDLFDRPTVVELRNLGDDEEKSFVMALLLVLLYEYAEARQESLVNEGKLQHLTLIEEAHRLLRATRGAAGPETPDAQAKAVTMFTDMLAELRAAGEGFIVADQVPTKLAPDVLKNSNVKILHRLVAPDDRYAAGGTINLTEPQLLHLATLRPGVAVVHDQDIGSPVLMRTEPLAMSSVPLATAVPEDRAYLQRNGACQKCQSPCDFADDALLPEAVQATPPGLGAFLLAVLLGDPREAWAAWTAWRGDRLTRVAGRETAVAAGITYCAATQGLWAMTAIAVPAGAPEVTEGRLALRRDRLGRALAEVVGGWLTSVALGDAELSAFSRAQRRLDQALAAPPVERVGCASCPRRCRSLEVVAPYVATLAGAVAARVGAATSTQTRLYNLRTALVGTPFELDDVPAATTVALLHCLFANANDLDWQKGAELLAELGTAPGRP
jgi:DNA helicase HerA-like ATPase